MLWSRRTIFMALVVGGPVILALIVRVLEMLGMPALRVNGQRIGGMGVFGVMIWMLFLRFIVPILGVFYGTALMADEVEDKTMTYLFTGPFRAAPCWLASTWPIWPARRWSCCRR